MKEKIRRRIVCLAMVLTLIVSGFAGIAGKAASAATTGPELLITELMPVPQTNDNTFEYIELYNNTDHSIDLKGYQFFYPQCDLAVSKVIPARGVMVICTQSTTTLQNFNAHYGTSLTEDKYMTLQKTGDSLESTGTYYVCLAKDDGNIVSIAQYALADFDVNKSISYKYPASGIEMIKFGLKQVPTPGSVGDGQVPAVNVAVAGVTLDKSAAVIKVGEIVKLNATVLPTTATNKDVNWTSSNSDIAQVFPGGLVLGKAQGTAVITVKTVDGNYAASCNIYVNPVTNTVPITAIQLDKTFTIVKTGDVFKLTAKVIPENATNKEITWTSSDLSVAEVYGGIVIARKAGDITITAKASNANVSASCRVIVQDNVNIPVTGVKLNKTELSIKEGSFENLIAAVLPENASNKKVIWQSSNPSKAAVDQSGRVAAKDEGEALITVRSVDGNFLAYCHVVILKAQSSGSVTGIRLNKSVLIIQNRKFQKLTAIITPVNAKNKKVTWSSNNKKVAVVGQDGKVVAVGPGIAVITATTADGGYSAKCIVVVPSDKHEDHGKGHGKGH